MKRTFNKSNWSGEEITINVNQSKKSFSLYGYDFTVKKDKEKSVKGMYEQYGVWSNDFWNGEYPIATVSKMTDENCWEAYDEDNRPYDGISRSDKNMYVAIVQYLCNVI